MTLIALKQDVDDISLIDLRYRPQLSEGIIWNLRPPPEMLVSEWADERRVLQAGTSRQPGPWSTGLTPYLKEIMDCYNDPKVRHLVLCFGTQLGKTETLYNILGFIIDMEPYSTMLVYPREEDAKSISRTRVQPMIEACPTVKEKKTTDKDLFQMLEMHFAGMVLYLVGANSAAALSQKSCRNILRDEVDKYPARVGKDSSPLALSEERAKSFWDIRKVVDVSSPTIEDYGIWKQLKQCEVVKSYYVPCPHCKKMQVLKWPQVQFEDTKDENWTKRIITAKKTAYYECLFCEEKIGDGDKPGMLEKGKWRPNFEIMEIDEEEYEEPETVEKIAFHLSSLYSPWLTWGDMAEKFLEAMRKREEGEIQALQVFINGWLAEPWVQKGETRTESQILLKRCDLAPLTIPQEAVAVTAGIDMQKVGFYFTVWAWTRDLESWLVDYGFLPEWGDVEQLVFESAYDVEGSGGEMSIWRAALDTGGGQTEGGWSRTDEAYQWLRAHGRGIIHGIKGLSRNIETGRRIRHTVIDTLPKKKKKIPGGLVLWLIDVNYFKETFFSRLVVGEELEEEKAMVHFHSETGKDFARSLLAEEKRLNNKGVYEWVQIRRDNHYLDATIYAFACADPQWAGGVKKLLKPGETARKRGRRTISRGIQ